MEFLQSFVRRHFVRKPEVMSPNVAFFPRLGLIKDFNSGFPPYNQYYNSKKDNVLPESGKESIIFLFSEFSSCFLLSAAPGNLGRGSK